MQDDAGNDGAAAAAAPSLAALRDDPYALLVEMERRARDARIGTSDDGAPGQEWSGVAFRVGELSLLTAREQVAEVLIPSEITRVPGAQPWLRGIAQLRGQLLPLTDLRAFLLDMPPPTNLAQSRVLVVNHRRVPAGLIVDGVHGFRRIADSRRRRVDIDALPLRLRPLVDGGFLIDDRVWPNVSLSALVESKRFLDPAV